MELLIVRHGSAVDLGHEGIAKDEDRVLNEQGQEETKALGRLLSKLNCIPDKAFTSPLTRAEQTTLNILQECGATELPIELSPALRPGATPMGIAGLLTSRASGAARPLVVGHLPDVGRFIGSLAGGDKVSLRFSAGAAALIEVPNPKAAWTGRLVWLIQPDTLKAL